MSIDGIGRPPVFKGDVGGAGGSGGAVSGEGFRLEAPPPTVAAAGSSEIFYQLERGELTVDAYLQARLDEAVRPLQGKVPPEQLQEVRSLLTEQLKTDPVVVELVRRATEGAKAKGEPPG
jgi:hypothetical protein